MVGQLGRMLVETAKRENISIMILDKVNAPAKQIIGTNSGVDGSFSDPAAIRELASKCDILTVEIEHVDTQVLEEIEREAAVKGRAIEIQPSWQTIRTIQDKYLQKSVLIDGQIDVAESIPIFTASKEDLGNAAKELGLPFMLKARTGAYDGRGNFAVKSTYDFEAALLALKDRPLYAEKWARFTKELAVMVVKVDEPSDPYAWESSTLAYPTTETVHEDSICKLTYTPARGVSAEVNRCAQDLARRAIANFKGRGIFGVEMFLLADNTLLVNEIAPRPHNSGHYTIEACEQSQYDTHLKAILDRPIYSRATELIRPAIMLNILGGSHPKSYLKLAKAADGVGAKVHLYGKGDATKGRKMGHVTITAASMEEAERRMEPLLRIFDDIRTQTLQSNPDPPEPASVKPISAPSAPLVSIVTGSISDQPILQPCYQILTDLGIPFERGIKSAHRTPDEMASYAKSAESRGIEVIIAAAGGAAHLPGMIAAFAPDLPVIGLPIKPSIGDGMDSLVSMSNMPNGVPVATVGVNKAPNAALLAARIVAKGNKDLKQKLRAYAKRAGVESLDNDGKMKEEWKRNEA